jgi:hypothetical protein
MEHRRYIPMKHQFQSMKDQFNDNIEKRRPYLIDQEVYEMINDINIVLSKRKRTCKNTKEDDM